MTSLLKYSPFRRHRRDSVDSGSGSTKDNLTGQSTLEKSEKHSEIAEEKDEVDPAASNDPDLNPSPGALSLEEGVYGGLCSLSRDTYLLFHLATDAAGGMGRHLGVFSCTLLM